MNFAESRYWHDIGAKNWRISQARLYMYTHIHLRARKVCKFTIIFAFRDNLAQKLGILLPYLADADAARDCRDTHSDIHCTRTCNASTSSRTLVERGRGGGREESAKSSCSCLRVARWRDPFLYLMSRSKIEMCVFLILLSPLFDIYFSYERDTPTYHSDTKRGRRRIRGIFMMRWARFIAPRRFICDGRMLGDHRWLEMKAQKVRNSKEDRRE